MEREAFINAMRLGAWCMRRLAQARCGNLVESLQEGLMTDGDLSEMDRVKMRAQIDAIDVLDKDVGNCTAYQAFGYASYMGGEPIEAAMKALGIDDTWMRKPDPEVRDKYGRTQVPPPHPRP